MKKNSFIFFLLTLLTSSTFFAQNGPVKSYYPDHKLKSELSFVNDILDGPAVWYHPNGKVMLEKNYSKGIIDGWVREYFENGQLKNEYYVNKGIKDGDEKKYFENGNLNEIISYDDGKLQNRQTFAAVAEPATKIKVEPSSTNQSSQKVSSNNQKVDDQVGKLVPPEIVGGISSVQAKIIYPEDALKFGLEGTVKIRLTVDANGDVNKTEILNGLGLGCSEAAINAIKQAKILAATKNGKPIQSEITIDIPFKLPVKKQEIAKEELKDLAVANPERKFEENLSVLCEADKCPRPVDDIATLYSLFQIPNVAKALKLRGMILIEGIVDKDGKFKQTKIVDGIGYGCDQLVETALQNSKFTVGIKKDQPVETKVLVNFPFSYDH